MSLFNRMMASVGIGSAKLDTLLEKTAYYPGEEVRGVVRIQGGAVGQRIEGIDLTIMTTYLKEINDSKIPQNVQLGTVRVSPPIDVQPNAALELPFSFYLASNTPLTMGRSSVWIKTTADIRSAVDPTDNDRIEVVPTPAMRAVMQAIELLGFRMREAETLYAPRLGGQHSPFVQEFEWVPYSGAYRGRLDELEVVFLRNQPSELELLLQIDRRATSLFGMFAEAMDMDESFVRVTVTNADAQRGPQHVASLLDQVISRYAH
ncbi:sporulation protein SpoOM [Paenibacillus sp. 1011MAR3C5]|uniref:sporulation protein n=1 Tax=Paenibacillus sp. 1011MAR3C5 TaxID=1675787 RepID=UPI000E6D00DE|nr:sporulation protein [Paenibacillus sp. 1011MAR3C5]RJE88758.1 sporulation protein SpoOM [Paenibacillus sp. 1011MAR3C5]